MPQLVVPAGSAAPTTNGVTVMPVAEMLLTFEFQSASPLFQLAFPLVVPDHPKAIVVTPSSAVPVRLNDLLQGAEVHATFVGEMADRLNDGGL
ncbi:MAG TPA: hypothetical protein VEC19_09495 [Usitatibacter sp.]|nr:hypothetical protein [Usitatibacter sp.]